MTKEINENIANEVQPQEIKEEKTRKLLVILVVLLFFGCAYYYYGNQKLSFSVGKVIKKQEAKVIAEKSSPEKINNIKSETGLNKQENKEENTKPIEEENIIENTKEEKFPETGKHKPTDKSYFTELSKVSSGKKDPFSFTESKFVPFAQIPSEGASFLPGTRSLPTVQGFSSGNQILDMPPTPKPEEAVVIKGFLGEKVIAKINGVVQSLKENDVVNNVKVININPSAYTVKFEIDGKSVTKTMKSLSDRDNKDIEIVKKLPQV